MKTPIEQARSIANAKLGKGEIVTESWLIAELEKRGATKPEAANATAIVFGEYDPVAVGGSDPRAEAAKLLKHAEEIRRYVAERKAGRVR